MNGLLQDYLQSYIEASFQDDCPLRSIPARKLEAIPPRTKGFKKTVFLYCVGQ